ncbi:uncharacterized protein LOC142829368 isoform X3 [Pelodiscus sinensis]|uniref:uncharacterized protein LOC142829368 isoform X3 n=1 Tax=Pelodiscus sinensis TaxID=13735 RepID=UPI003F6D7270
MGATAERGPELSQRDTGISHRMGSAQQDSAAAGLVGEERVSEASHTLPEDLSQAVSQTKLVSVSTQHGKAGGTLKKKEKRRKILLLTVVSLGTALLVPQQNFNTKGSVCDEDQEDESQVNETVSKQEAKVVKELRILYLLCQSQKIADETLKKTEEVTLPTPGTWLYVIEQLTREKAKLQKDLKEINKKLKIQKDLIKTGSKEELINMRNETEKKRNRLEKKRNVLEMKKKKVKLFIRTALVYLLDAGNSYESGYRRRGNICIPENSGPPIFFYPCAE